MSTKKTLDELLTELRQERIALEKRMSANIPNTSAASLSRDFADEMSLESLDRREASLLAEQEKSESEKRKRDAFESMLDTAFGISGDDADHNGDDN